MKNLKATADCFACTYQCLKNVISESECQLLNDNKIDMHFAAGEKIISQGGFVAQFAYLKQGIAKKIIEDKGKKGTLLSVQNHDNLMALSVLGNPDIYPFSIIAVTECKVCYIRKETLISIIEQNNKANNFVLQWNAKNHLFLFNKIHILNTRNSHGKLASVLLHLAKQEFDSNVFHSLSRKDLAELSSISVESTNKILTQLKNDGIISISNDGLNIERLDLIERLSTVG